MNDEKNIAVAQSNAALIQSLFLRQGLDFILAESNLPRFKASRKASGPMYPEVDGIVNRIDIQLVARRGDSKLAAVIKALIDNMGPERADNLGLKFQHWTLNSDGERHASETPTGYLSISGKGIYSDHFSHFLVGEIQKQLSQSPGVDSTGSRRSAMR